jgi:hypothetical protein
MWPFSGVEKEISRREADQALERAREEAERRARLETPARYECAHLEEDEEYVLVGPAVVPPKEPVFGAKGETGPTGPVGPKGGPGIPGACGSGYTGGTTYGVPNTAIRDLHTMSIKTGIKPETLLGILESAIDELPNTLLKEMKEL